MCVHVFGVLCTEWDGPLTLSTKFTGWFTDVSHFKCSARTATDDHHLHNNTNTNTNTNRAGTMS